jgi:hypothetical protein
MPYFDMGQFSAMLHREVPDIVTNCLTISKAYSTLAVSVLDCSEGCGDSSYSCLRSFENQAVHSRLKVCILASGGGSYRSRLRLFHPAHIQLV